jgi:hypothetical protein
MTESMITVALIVGDPAHEDLQLNQASLAAAARTIGVHGAVIHGRRDSGRRSTVWCFDIERARAADLKDDLQDICVLRRPRPGCPGTCALPVAVMSPRLRHLSVPCPQKLMHLAADQAQGGLWAALNCTRLWVISHSRHVVW